ncbi:hypothetical protein LXL04_031287 [Taraxacum kok-saghyz]
MGDNQQHNYGSNIGHTSSATVIPAKKKHVSTMIAEKAVKKVASAVETSSSVVVSLSRASSGVVRNSTPTETGFCSDDFRRTAVFLPVCKRQVSYIFGDNPLGMSYVVGYGNNYPKQVHHRGASIAWDHQWHSCAEGSAWLNSSRKSQLPIENIIGGILLCIFLFRDFLPIGMAASSLLANFSNINVHCLILCIKNVHDFFHLVNKVMYHDNGKA